MAAVVQPAATVKFGITGVGTDNFQSKSISTKFDKKEGLNNQGEVIAWAFYGKMAEHSIELLGTNAISYALGAVIVAPTGIDAAVGGTVFCVDELTVDRTNDDFAKSTIKVSEYLMED